MLEKTSSVSLPLWKMRHCKSSMLIHARKTAFILKCQSSAILSLISAGNLMPYVIISQVPEISDDSCLISGVLFIWVSWSFVGYEENHLLIRAACRLRCLLILIGASIVKWNKITVYYNNNDNNSNDDNDNNNNNNNNSNKKK